MIVLLAISTVVAVIAPQPAERAQDRSETTPTLNDPEDPGWPNQAVTNRLHSVVNTDRDQLPKQIVAFVGDRLRLEVKGRSGRMVSIPDLGLLETQSRSAPATFDLYFDQVGGYEVVDADSGTRLARIVIEMKPRSAEASAKPKPDPPAQPDASPQAEPA